MFKYKRAYILNFIAQILNPKSQLKDYRFFSVDTLFWDKLVKIGSKHLLLPAIYASLKRKDLHDNIPKELKKYLERIYHLNGIRNKEILKQLKYISKLLNNNNIEYVFIKGAALLIYKPYDTIHERMVGDIDILVSQKDLFRCEKLLENGGFSKSDKSKNKLTNNINLSNYSHHHLERLTSPDFIASIEIHQEILPLKHLKILPAKKMLQSKKKIEEFYIPTRQNLWKNAILNLMYNDNAIHLNYLSFRTVKDVFYLESKDLYKNLRLHHNSFNHFYNLLSIYDTKYPSSNFFRKYHYILQIKYPFLFKINKFLLKLRFISSIIVHRFLLIFKSNKYRSRLFSNPTKLFYKFLEFWKK